MSAVRAARSVGARVCISIIRYRAGSTASFVSNPRDPAVVLHRPTARAVETIVRFDPKGSKPRSPAQVADAPVAVTPEVLGKGSGSVAKVREVGGRADGTEPTRFGDWEKNGRCIDF